MPNWCYNKLIVIGEEGAVSKFFRAVEAPNVRFSLERLCPTPAELLHQPVWLSEKQAEEAGEKSRELKEKYGALSWYDWRVKNWGTKWDVCDARVDCRKDGRAEYRFETAWAPPLVAIKRIAKDFPELEFRLEYVEPGMGFAGTLVLAGGEVAYRYFSEDFSGNEFPRDHLVQNWTQ